VLRIGNPDLSNDQSAHSASRDLRDVSLGFVEAFVLSIVAVATAWSGYRAARWDGMSTTNYALHGQYTALSEERATLAGQDRLYDIVTFNSWLSAQTAGQEKLAGFYMHRFRPEYAAAFGAWLRLDPFHKPNAPPGPIFMPEYRDANATEAHRLAAISTQYFRSAISSRQTGDDYVRVTVLFATILFLTALSQRFRIAGPRAVVLVIAAILLGFSVFHLLTLHRT
jgi:hypothetical protein